MLVGYESVSPLQYCAASSGLMLAANQRGPWIAFGARDTTMPPSCSIVVRQSRARLRLPVLASLLSRTRLECSRNHARSHWSLVQATSTTAEMARGATSGVAVRCFCVHVRPRVPASLGAPLSSPLPSSPHEPITLLPQQAQPLCPRPDKTRSQTQGLSNSKRNAHPFLNNLARPAFPLHREITLPATGTPTTASLTSFSRFSLCLPCPASTPCQSTTQVPRCQCLVLACFAEGLADAI